MKKLHLLTRLSGLLFVFLFLTAFTSRAQMTLMPSDDGTAIKSTPDENINAKHASNIYVYKTDTDEAIAFVKFDVSGFANRMVKNAVFSTRSDMNDDKTMTVKLTKAGAEFTRAELTWNNKPSTSDELATVVMDMNSDRKNYSPNGTKLIDYINSKLAEGATEIAFGLVYKSGDGADFKWAGGKGDNSWGPMLELTFDKGLTYYPSDDASAIKETPDASVNEKDANNIFVYKTDTDEAISYIEFTLNGFAHKTITVAKFSTRSDMNDGKTMTVKLTKVDGDITREGTTWNNKPGISDELATTVYDENSERKEFIPDGSKLVDYINAELMKGNEVIRLGIAYKDGDGGDLKWIGGKGNGNWGPMLYVEKGDAFKCYASDDGAAIESTPDASVNDVHASNIYVYKTDTDEAIAYLKFDVSSISGRQISEAKLSTRSDMNNGKTMTVMLTKAGSEFTRSELTWNSKPSTGDEVATCLLDEDSGRKYFTSSGTALVDYINAKLMEGVAELAFGIKYKDGDGADFKWMAGKGDASWGPMLELVFDNAYSGYALEDAVAVKSTPDATANDKHDSNIYVYKTDTDEAIAFIKFDVSGLAGEKAKKVDFSLRSDMNDGKTMTVKLTEAGDDFARSTTTWNNKPETNGELATTVLDEDSGRKTFTPNGSNLVDYVNKHIAMGADVISFGLVYKDGDGADFKWAGGLGDGSWGPMLGIELDAGRPDDVQELTVIEDVYVSEADPDKNFGDAGADMHVVKTADGSKQILIKFDISETAGAIGAVTLKLKGDMKDTNPDQLDQFNIEVLGTTSDEWAEGDGTDGVTWNTKPEITTDVLADYAITGSAVHEVTSDALTHYVNNAIAAGRGAVTFVIRGKDDTGENRAWISSKDRQAPLMALDYTEMPPEQTLQVVADVYVSEVDPDKNFDLNAAGDAEENDMHIIKQDGANKHIYVKFDISNAHQNVSLVSAAVEMRGAQKDAELDHFYVNMYACNDNSWTEGELTWNTKPAAENKNLGTVDVQSGGSKYYKFTSSDLKTFIQNAINAGKDHISFVFKAQDDTDGVRAWFSSKGWSPGRLVLNYEPQTDDPIIKTPANKDYIQQVDVEIVCLTPESNIYYTTDGSEPTDQSTQYAGPFALTESSTVKAIAYAPELKPSAVVSKSFTIIPVSLPTFTTYPGVYRNATTVYIDVVPDDAFILWTDGDGEPLTPYDKGTGIVLDEEGVFTIKAQAFSADGEYQTELIEGTFTIVFTTPGPGTGPGGVGYKNNKVSGQPLNSLWLAADAISGVADGEMVLEWNDMSGNEFVAIGSEDKISKPDNYHKDIEPAPIYVSDGINGLPALNFGDANVDPKIPISALHIPDAEADLFDGINGISMFVLAKRNETNDAHSAFFEKRNYNDKVNDSWVLQFNGNSSNQLQFTLDANSQHTYCETMGMEVGEKFIVNAERDAIGGRTLMYLNGHDETRSGTYGDPIKDANCPLVIGNGSKMNIGEIILYSEALNSIQRDLVFNYLAVKYGLPLTDKEGNDIKLYSNVEYTNRLIGIGKKENPFDATVTDAQSAASGDGLVLTDYNLTLQAGDVVVAAHNGEDGWQRAWNIELVNAADVDVAIGFNLAQMGLDAPTGFEGYKLLKDGEDTGLTPSLKEGILEFQVESIEAGVYAIEYSGATLVVATPTITPGTGSYEESQTVTITTTTEGADIYYTTDGSEPTESSTKYTGEFTVSETTTIKAIAVKADMDNSAVAEAELTISVGIHALDISNQVDIYPNPTKGNIRITLNNEAYGDITIKIKDVVGKDMQIISAQKATNNFVHDLNINNFKSGYYFIELTIGNQKAVKAIIKQ